MNTKILIADDEPFYRQLLETMLRGWSFDVSVCDEGTRAWDRLKSEDGPRLAILDWDMPGLEGPEICRKLSTVRKDRPPYVILLTANTATERIYEGLRAGANDYVTKPFRRQELFARLQVAQRVLLLQEALADRVRELEDALISVKELHGLLPMCAWCKKVRDDQNYWQEVECYIAEHSDAKVTHGICPACMEKAKADSAINASNSAKANETPKQEQHLTQVTPLEENPCDF